MTKPGQPTSARFIVYPTGGGEPYIVEAKCCEADNSQHDFGRPAMAQVRVHWVTGPIDMCVDCAEKLVWVGQVLGTLVHYEQILVPPDPDQPAERALSLGKVPIP